MLLCTAPFLASRKPQWLGRGGWWNWKYWDVCYSRYLSCGVRNSCHTQGSEDQRFASKHPVSSICILFALNTSITHCASVARHSLISVYMETIAMTHVIAYLKKEKKSNEQMSMASGVTKKQSDKERRLQSTAAEHRFCALKDSNSVPGICSLKGSGKR